MGDDFTVLAIIPFVTAITQVVKGFLPEALRDRLTVVVAMALGVLLLGIYQTANGIALCGAQAICQLALRGIASGLAAVGLYESKALLKKKE